MLKIISTKQRLKRHASNFDLYRNFAAPIFKVTLLPVHSRSELLNNSNIDFDLTPPFIPLTIFPSNNKHLISGSIHITKLAANSTSAVRGLFSLKNQDTLAILVFKSSDDAKVSNSSFDLLSSSDLSELFSLFPLSLDQSINQLSLNDSAILSVILLLSWIEVELSSVVFD